MNTTNNNDVGNTVDNTDRRSREKSAGSGGLGNKVRGVAEIVHGVGENIRGTMLGAVDTLSKNGTTKNDETAHKGRLETERGLANLRGGEPSSHVQPASSQSTYGNHASTNPGAIGSGAGFQGNNFETTHGGYGRHEQGPNQTAGQARATDATGTQYPIGTGAEPGGDIGSTAATQIGHQPDFNYQGFGNTNQQGSTSYPHHHREDAIGIKPDSQLRGVQQPAYDHPYNPAHDASTGADLNQSQQAYGSQSHKPS